MIAPAALIVEIAMGQLADKDYREKHMNILVDQVKEVQSAVPGRSADFYEGYQLGVQTARALLAGMPAAALNKVSI
jgi:hypothetical protein